MKVHDVMTTVVELIASGDTVLEAAKIMAEQDVGFLPVARDDRLIGVITDRDIVVRVVAIGHDPSREIVDEVMTPGTKYCYDDEDLAHVARNMAALGLSRLPVMNRDKRLVGIVSLDDIPAMVALKPGAWSPTMGATLP